MEGKGAFVEIFNRLDGRVLQIERCGCPEGNVRKERIDNAQRQINKHDETIEKIFDKIDAINTKFFIGLVILIIVAFMAGVNIMQNLPLIK